MASVYQTTANVFSAIRDLIGKDTNTISDATLLRFCNKHYLWIMRELNQAEYLSGEISVASTVANQQEYALPTDDTATTFGGGTYQVLRVEAKLDGTNWYILPEIDLLTYPQVFDDTGLTSRYTTTNPAFAWFDNSIWIWPIPTTAVTNGIRIFQLKRPDEIAATTTIPSLHKDFLNVLEGFVRSDALIMLGRTAESAAVKQESYTLLERAKELTEQADRSLRFTPRYNISDYK